MKKIATLLIATLAAASLPARANERPNVIVMLCDDMGAHELGLYRDPLDYIGLYSDQGARAARLVIDTGLHTMGWTRQQAIDFFKDNAAKTELDIINEIDRYILWPGQALAYKIGQLKILQLRERAEIELGDKFDIRAFHDELLGAGALPLDLLEQRMDKWMAAQ